MLKLWLDSVQFTYLDKVVIVCLGIFYVVSLAFESQAFKKVNNEKALLYRKRKIVSFWKDLWADEMQLFEFVQIIISHGTVLFTNLEKLV